jgi:hypothetical protein
MIAAAEIEPSSRCSTVSVQYPDGVAASDPAAVSAGFDLDPVRDVINSLN